MLENARKLLTRHRDSLAGPDPRWVDHVMGALSGTFTRIATAVEAHESRRTMPITNSKKSAHVIGYRYRDNAGPRYVVFGHL